jgi:S-adenosylmethionine/arginine decarboxylase-like enzyme
MPDHVARRASAPRPVNIGSTAELSFDKKGMDSLIHVSFPHITFHSYYESVPNWFGYPVKTSMIAAMD